MWNAACSTGEETWTLALLAAGTDDDSALPLSMLATDLSEPALAKARGGSYDRLHGLDSFRALGADLGQLVAQRGSQSPRARRKKGKISHQPLAISH